MKIYRLVECTGVYEDYFEYRIGTYLNKDKALEVKRRAEDSAKQAEKQSELCAQCFDEDDKCQKLCMSYKKVNGFPDDCANCLINWDPATYRLDEEEVIE